MKVNQRRYSSLSVCHSEAESSAHHLTPAQHPEELKDAVTAQEEKTALGGVL